MHCSCKVRKIEFWKTLKNWSKQPEKNVPLSIQIISQTYLCLLFYAPSWVRSKPTPAQYIQCVCPFYFEWEEWRENVRLCNTHAPCPHPRSWIELDSHQCVMSGEKMFIYTSYVPLIIHMLASHHPISNNKLWNIIFEQNVYSGVNDNRQRNIVWWKCTILWTLMPVA